MRLLLYTLTGLILFFGLLGSIQSYAQDDITVPTVIVSDNLRSTQNLIGGYDQDDADDRALALHWNFGDSEFVDIHIYIEDLINDQHHYLGRTADGTATSFEWRSGNSNLNPEYTDGPQFGESYRFIVFGLVDADKNRQWIYTNDPITLYDTETPQPTSTPTPINFEITVHDIVVTDDLHSTQNLVNLWDQDDENDRQLVIRWPNIGLFWDDADERVIDYHVYVRDSVNNELEYLGRPSNVNQLYLVWKEGNRNIHPTFRYGPQWGNSYDFVVYRIEDNGYIGTFSPPSRRQPVLYLSNDDPTPTPTPTHTFTPTNTLKPTFTFSPTFTPLPPDIKPPYEITIEIPGLDENLVQPQFVWIQPNEAQGGYFMGKHEITNAQFVAFINENGDRGRLNVPYHATQPILEYPIEIEKQNGEWSVVPGYENHPVRGVNWYGADAFCQWLSTFDSSVAVRLPDFLEWIYSCRAGTKTRVYWGDDDDHTEVCMHANLDDFSAWLSADLCDDGFAFSAPVGSYRPNPFGLHDMIGNVREICNRLPFTSEDTPINPDPGTDIYIRGGAWHDGQGMNTADSFSIEIERRSDSTGFRAAASVNPGFEDHYPIEQHPPTATPETPTNTPTRTPTPVPTIKLNTQEITIDLPNLPDGAKPLQLVWIEPGSFMMSSSRGEPGSQPNEYPKHEVIISKGFYMGKHEITIGQYYTYVIASGTDCAC